MFVFFILLMIVIKCNRVNSISALLIISLLIYINTETFSYFNILNTFSVRLFWLFAIIILLAFLWISKPKFELEQYFKFLRNNIIFISILSVFVVVLIFLCVYVPTTNTDSQNYHMARVLYWKLNENIQFYPSFSGTQLYYNPLAEYLNLQTVLYYNSIRFVNLIQLVAMIGTCITISLIISLYTKNSTLQKTGFLLCLFLPMALFQSTTTQNDLVVAFYTCCALYFLLKISKSKAPIISDFIFLGLALGLSGLTKFTGWLVFFPFLVYLVIFNIRKIKYFILSATITILLLLPFVCQNIKVFQHPLKPNESSLLYADDILENNITMKSLFSNTIKNSATIAALPLNKLNNITSKVVIKIHSILDIPLNDKELAIKGHMFNAKFIFHEDTVSNFIYFYLFIVVCLLAVLYYKSYLPEIVCLLVGLLTLLALLNWMPFNNRLFVIWFCMTIPFLVLVLSQQKWSRFLLQISVVISFLLACVILFLNPSKPIIDIYSKQFKNRAIVLSSFDKNKLNNDTIFNEYYKYTNFIKLNLYQIKDTTINDNRYSKLLQQIDYPTKKSLLNSSFYERHFPNDLSIQHQLNNLNSVLNNSTNMAVSFLKSSREYLILYNLLQNKNINHIQNIGVLSSLKDLPNSKKPFSYDYLITNNFLLENKINQNDIDTIYDFAYFKLYHFKSTQNKKYIVKDVLQEAYNKLN